MLLDNICVCLLYRVLLDKSSYKYPGVMDFVMKLYTDSNRSPYMLAFLINMYEEMLEDSPKDEDTLQRAVKVRLITDDDHTTYTCTQNCPGLSLIISMYSIT